MIVDLNADLGEGSGYDAELMPWITSANICCGEHAGSPEEMRATVELAKQFCVVIGAHPGFADRENFGRVELDLPAHEIKSLCFRQIAALHAAGADVKYLKPHGALYHLAMRDESAARGVALAAEAFGLSCVGLAGSKLEMVCERFIPEGFADRRYRADGSLVPRSEPDAVLHDIGEAVEQAERLIRKRGIRTLCVHGDSPLARALLPALREHLKRTGIAVRPFAL